MCCLFDTPCRLLYWCDLRRDDQAGLYVYSLNDATKSRLLPKSEIRPRALAVDFAGMLILCVCQIAINLGIIWGPIGIVTAF